MQLRKTKLDEHGDHFYEHTRDEKILPWREWCRKYMPKGSEGFTFEDVDGMVALHGPLSPRGTRFMLIEYKWWDVALDLSQVKNFRLLHALLRRGDPTRQTYIGFYIVEWPRVPTASQVRVNYKYLLNGADLYAFYAMQEIYPAYFEMENKT
jgi:hypothetical protein